MTQTASNMLPLSTELPRFELPIVEGLENGVETINKTGDGSSFLSNQTLDARPVLLMFLCSHCPFVKHVEDELTRLDKDYGRSVQILAIASNSLITHPQDGPKQLAAQAERLGWNFPYLFDADQSFAKALQAACTPEFFLFSANKAGAPQELRYRGQLDESRPGNTLSVTGNDLRVAIDAVLLGHEVNIDQKPSIGCNIKWHPGEEPFWFK